MEDIDSKELEELMKELEKVKNDSIEIFNDLGTKDINKIQESNANRRENSNLLVGKHKEVGKVNVISNAITNTNNKEVNNIAGKHNLINNDTNETNSSKVNLYDENLRKDVKTILLKTSNLENAYNITIQNLKIINDNVDQINHYLKNKFIQDYKFEKIVVKSLLELIKLNSEIINLVKSDLGKKDNDLGITINKSFEEIKVLLKSLEDNFETKIKKEAELLDTIIRLLSIK